MRKIFISLLVAMVAYLWGITLSSCESYDELVDSSPAEYISINVSRNSLTRAVSDGSSTSLSSGDAIGVYALDGAGKVVAANVKYTYSGSGWSSLTPIVYSSTYKYYAYFPYQESPTGGPAVGIKFSSTTADDVFASLVSSWTPKADQSTAANFVASDLCVSQSSGSSSSITFSLKHSMALVKGVATANYRLTVGDEYTFSTERGYTPPFSGNLPFKVGDYYYYVVKPQSTVSLGGKDINVKVNGGYLVNTVWNDPTTGDFELQLGDIVYTDGCISHQSDELLADREPCGVVVYVTDPTNENDSKVLEGKTHALVLERNSLGEAPWGYYKTKESTGDFPLVQNLSAAYTDFNGINKTNLLAAKYDGSTATNSETNKPYIPYRGPYLVANYTGKKPEGSTQWFLPASGQWVAFLNQVINSGGGKPISTTEGWWPNCVDNDENNPYVAYKKLSTWCSKAGGSFSSTWEWYWTSSQSSAENGFNVSVSSWRGVYVVANYKYLEDSWRCFFAF